VAGSWYPGRATALADAVDAYLAAADAAGRVNDSHDIGAIDAIDATVAIVAPHAGLVYSGPVAAYAYRQLRGMAVDLAVLVGPSHFAGFDGVALHGPGGFETPLGIARIDEAAASALMAATGVVHERAAVHAREHALEMQLPFLQRVAPDAAILPLLMGFQTEETARALGDGLAAALRGRRAILVASTDLSHYKDGAAASRLDAVVIDHVSRFDADGLQRALARRPEHACGGGPTVAVMRAAQLLGARHASILKYGDSGDVSGDKSSVVGYLAAAFSSPVLRAEPRSS
jgi:AmmeMemoRadiSam system protein B